MAIPACNLATVRACELRVDGLASIQALYLGDGRAAVQRGANGVARSGRKRIGEVEELFACFLGCWMRSTRQIAVQPPFPRRSSVFALRPGLDMEDGLNPGRLAALPAAATGQDEHHRHQARGVLIATVLLTGRG
jgi:hypothetical protein